ncbi:hypothetical protein Dimus_009920 [Dionaea muscipula]
MVRRAEENCKFHSRMEVAAFNTLSSFRYSKVTRDPNVKVRAAYNLSSLVSQRKLTIITSSLPETASSLGIAMTIVGAAAVLLRKRMKPSVQTEVLSKTCEDCRGSGICSECSGKGFVLKKMSEGSAEKARMNSTNMATRYTAGLPKKWSYCTKCSSARSCSTCSGSGRLSL